MRRTLFIIILILFTVSVKANIFINEIMQSNIDCIMDDLNEFPDSWLELYNNETEEVNIENYILSLNEDGSNGYVIPPAIVPSNGYLIIYCDKVGEGLHASFRIDSGKGSLYLFNEVGVLVDHIDLKKQPAPNVAFGRSEDGSNEWGYQLQPSPGASNQYGISEIILKELMFSELGGVFNIASDSQFSFDVSLTYPEDREVSIIYTLDGTEPTMENGMMYTKPIEIHQSTVVRAKAFAEGCISIPSSVQSYIFLDREQKIPVISITTDPKFLYDDTIGILVKGLGGYENPNYGYNWRRPINLEYFPVNQEAALNQLCEMRIHGGASRSLTPLNSLVVYANKRFGTKRFEYEFWESDKPGIKENKSFLLRNGGNDVGQGFIRDGISQRMMGYYTDVDWQGYSPAIVYLNGMYYAMLGLRERSNEDNIYSNYNGLEDIDMIENWSEIKMGDDINFKSFENFYSADEEKSIEEWLRWMDIEEYTNMMILAIWVGNTDFPHNNIIMWRPRNEDGKWRWILKDFDFAFGLYDYNVECQSNYNFFNWFYEEKTKVGSKLFLNLLKNDDYKDYFLNHWIAYTGDFLNEEKWLQLLNDIIEESKGELLICYENFWDTPNKLLLEWEERIPNWIKERQGYIPYMVQEYFGLGDLVPITVNQDLSSDIKIKYGDVYLTQSKFNGFDYVGRTLKISSDTNIKGWNVLIGSSDTRFYEGNSFEMLIEDTSPIEISVVPLSNGIKDCDLQLNSNIYLDANTGIVYGSNELDVYDIQGRHLIKSIGSVKLPSKGFYIVNQTKIIW